ncbi:hypothetical protein [Azoarcus indigens]|uniref:Chemotaxis protein n=1 Tax=Azoarcus indigens TaxID=29545 RepID=A0A4R6ECQ8_9RHOO|nr:hypothetical protein [Azoarcus indigens]TDN55950.1 hypothetical protein C7389_103288 [Azoarcus indigens]
MGTTLNPPLDRKPETGKGHGTGALGPSDSSDSGSDIVGGPGLAGEASGQDLGLDSGPTGDPGSDDARNAGADVGDAGLDSDTDAAGTGERAAAGRDAPAETEIDLALDHGKPQDLELEDDAGTAAGNETPEQAPDQETAGASRPSQQDQDRKQISGRDSQHKSPDSPPAAKR